jgi:hypothetical protein
VGVIGLTVPRKLHCLLFTCVSLSSYTAHAQYVLIQAEPRRTLDGGKDELIDKLLLQVFDDHALGTESKSLLLDLGEVLDLADVGKKSLEAIWVSVGPKFERGAG